MTDLNLVFNVMTTVATVAAALVAAFLHPSSKKKPWKSALIKRKKKETHSLLAKVDKIMKKRVFRDCEVAMEVHELKLQEIRRSIDKDIDEGIKLAKEYWEYSRDGITPPTDPATAIGSVLESCEKSKGDLRSILSYLESDLRNRLSDSKELDLELIINETFEKNGS